MNKEKDTTFLSISNVGAFLSFLILSFVVAMGFNPIVESNAVVKTISEDLGAYNLSMSVDSDVEIDINPSHDHTITTASNYITFTNTCPRGASILASASDESNELVGDNGYTIPTISSDGELLDNTWGISPDNGYSWYAVPTISQNPLKVYESSNATDDAFIVPVLYGLKIDPSIPSGIYSKDVLYTIVPSSDCYGSPINWDANGGVNPDNYPAMANVDGSINLSALLRPTRQYYTFAGWSNGTEIFTGDETNALINPNNDSSVTMTALWTPEQYTISYTLNGGSASNLTSYNIESNAITLANPTRPAYTFVGWSGTDLSGSANKNVIIPAGSHGERSYTANWTPTNYTITYNYNGGSATNPTTYNIETSSFTLNNPARSGLVFAGWSGTGLSGSANKTVTITQGSTGNRSYTANWAPTTTTWNYGYTGGMQSFTVPASGTYKLEVWGAQGGSYGSAGGYGGYSIGNKALSAGTVLYIGVGGQGSSTETTSAPGGVNGGGTGTGWAYPDSSRRGTGSGGGGATHIGLTNSWLAKTSVGNLLIAAGGGGGAGGQRGWESDGSSANQTAAGGAGGGTTGGRGGNNNEGYGGTQSAGGSFYGSYGTGGSAYGGGGGGGYYGGGGGNHSAGGGGSGYIGGVTGGSMANGQRSGHGYARITWIGN